MQQPSFSIYAELAPLVASADAVGEARALAGGEIMLDAQTITWLARLPCRVRPIELGRTFPQIANHLSVVWRSRELTTRYLAVLSLGIARRSRSFPEGVAAEIRALNEFHCSSRLQVKAAGDESLTIANW